MPSSPQFPPLLVGDSMASCITTTEKHLSQVALGLHFDCLASQHRLEFYHPYSGEYCKLNKEGKRTIYD